MQQKSIFFLFVVIGAIIAIPFGYLALVNSSMGYAIIAGIGIGILLPSIICLFLLGDPVQNKNQLSTIQSVPLQPSTPVPERMEPAVKKEEIKSTPIAKTAPNLNTPVSMTQVKSQVSTIKTNSDFIQKIIKLGEMVQECQELVDGEAELSKREQTKLYLKRDEFRKLYKDVKASHFDCF
jgi:hypothetical protein